MSNTPNFYLSPRDREVVEQALDEFVRNHATETGEAWREKVRDADRLREQLEEARFRMDRQDFKDRFKA